jgi:hypothetical protein
MKIWLFKLLKGRIILLQNKLKCLSQEHMVTGLFQVFEFFVKLLDCLMTLAVGLLFFCVHKLVYLPHNRRGKPSQAERVWFKSRMGNKGSRVQLWDQVVEGLAAIAPRSINSEPCSPLHHRHSTWHVNSLMDPPADALYKNLVINLMTFRAHLTTRYF